VYKYTYLLTYLLTYLQVPSPDPLLTFTRFPADVKITVINGSHDRGFVQGHRNKALLNSRQEFQVILQISKLLFLLSHIAKFVIFCNVNSDITYADNLLIYF